MEGLGEFSVKGCCSKHCKLVDLAIFDPLLPELHIPAVTLLMMGSIPRKASSLPSAVIFCVSGKKMYIKTNPRMQIEP